MRAVNVHNQNWVFSKKGNFIGLRTGGDFCAEHEMGIACILDALIPERSTQAGLAKFLVSTVPASLEWVSYDDYEGILFDPVAIDPEHSANKLRHLSLRSRGHDPIIAWDEKTFLLAASKQGDRRYTKALKSLWSALLSKDVYLGGPFSDRFSGGGIGFFIASKMPKDEVDAAESALTEKDRAERLMAEGAKREKFEKVKEALSRRGHAWFCLKPHGINEADGSVTYWLNPQDQDYNYFGPVTIQDLKDWLAGYGKIPGGGRRAG